MKRILPCLLFLAAFSISLRAQTYGRVGTGGDFLTLKAAFDYINHSGETYDDIYLEIISDITESSTAILYESGHDGISFYTSITIYPTVSGLTISGDLDAPLIEINGATKVVVDGRLHDVQGPAQNNNKDLIINNSSPGSSASTIRFAGSSNQSAVRYCTIKGSETGAS